MEKLWKIYGTFVEKQIWRKQIWRNYVDLTRWKITDYEKSKTRYNKRASVAQME